MKQILIILGLFASVTTFAQSPRIKLNQITKDTVKGSVLISSPSDSGMVYSRDFYIAYGADTVLILYGDTLGGVGGGFASVLSDGVTVTGNGTSGNELKVDTATVISTIQGLVDTLTNRGYLTANQTITLSGDVTGSGTTAITATVVDDSHNHIITNVDFLQDSLNAKANDSDLSNYVTLSGAQTITGAKTFTNTFTQSGGDANFDSGTLYVDESANRVGIGTSEPSFNLTAGNGNGGAAIYIYGNLVSGSALRLGPSASSILQHYGEGFDPNAVNEVIAIGSGDANTYLVFNSGGTEKIRVLINGNVGIGTSTPSYKLDVVGDINASGEVRNSGVILTSDARYKKDITPLYNANNKLMQFNPVSYYWNDLMLQRMEESKSKTKTSIKYGLVAQEVEAIMPEFVSEGEDGYKAIDYQAIITLLIKSNQEQQTEINQLKTLITDLTNRLIILENK